MSAEDPTRREGGGGTRIVRHAGATTGDTVMLIADEASSVRVAPADELPKTERSGADAHPSTFSERFEDQGEIARGGMGAVHRVFDRANPENRGTEAPEEECRGTARCARTFPGRGADLVPDLKLPPGLTRIALRALSAERSQRHPSVEALREDVARFLRGGGWFRSLTFRQGTIIVREGDAPDAAYIITRGSCEAYEIQDGERRTLRRMGPGEAFGETSIFTAQPRTASVVALDDVEVTEITLEALEQELGGHSWTSAFVRALAERFLSVDRELEGLRKKQDGTK